MSDAITVRQLIELLRGEDPDAEVIAEGCDCLGDAVGVSKHEDGGVVVRRGDGPLGLVPMRWPGGES